MSLYAIFATGECPARWTNLAVADGKLILLADSGLGDAGGTDSVNHNHATSTSVLDYDGANYPKALNPASMDLMPSRVKLVLCQVPQNAYVLYPQNAVLLSDDDCPDGYTAEDSHVGKFVMITNVDDDAGDSVAEDLGDHNHTRICNRCHGSTNQQQGAACTTSTDNLIDDWEDLSHVKLRFCKKD